MLLLEKRIIYQDFFKNGLDGFLMEQRSLNLKCNPSCTCDIFQTDSVYVDYIYMNSKNVGPFLIKNAY